MSQPQTAREAYMAEMLGEVMGAADKLEALKTDIPAVVKAAVEEIAAASAAAIRAEQQAFAALKTDLAKERGAWRAAAGDVTREAVAAANVVHGSSRRFFWFIVGLAGLVGALAGGGAGLVLFKMFAG